MIAQFGLQYTQSKIYPHNLILYYMRTLQSQSRRFSTSQPRLHPQPRPLQLLPRPSIVNIALDRPRVDVLRAQLADFLHAEQAHAGFDFGLKN